MRNQEVVKVQPNHLRDRPTAGSPTPLHRFPSIVGHMEVEILKNDSPRGNTDKLEPRFYQTDRKLIAEKFAPLFNAIFRSPRRPIFPRLDTNFSPRKGVSINFTVNPGLKTETARTYLSALGFDKSFIDYEGTKRGLTVLSVGPFCCALVGFAVLTPIIMYVLLSFVPCCLLYIPLYSPRGRHGSEGG